MPSINENPDDLIRSCENCLHAPMCRHFWDLRRIFRRRCFVKDIDGNEKYVNTSDAFTTIGQMCLQFTPLDADPPIKEPPE